jgi:hypothetical protein
MNTIFSSKMPGPCRNKNRRLGWALALLTILYLAAVIAFIVAY